MTSLRRSIWLLEPVWPCWGARDWPQNCLASLGGPELAARACCAPLGRSNCRPSSLRQFGSVGVRDLVDRGAVRKAILRRCARVETRSEQLAQLVYAWGMDTNGFALISARACPNLNKARKRNRRLCATKECPSGNPERCGGRADSRVQATWHWGGHKQPFRAL